MTQPHLALEELRQKLQVIADRQQANFSTDKEIDHSEADQLLLDYINDEDVTTIYYSIDKWYA